MPFVFDWDGHIHSGFCPHGSGEPTRASIDRAIELGFRGVSIIEHYPLPPGFPEPPTSLPVGPGIAMVDPYLEETLALRDEYADRIEVRVGFEWDYLPGWEDWTIEQLERTGPQTQDGLLSVHFLKESIIDETAEIFIRSYMPLVDGILEKAYLDYYETVMASVKADLGQYKPQRLSHINLIRRSQVVFPAPGEFRNEIIEIVREAASRNMQLDLNMSGLRRQNCKEPFVPVWLIELIARNEIEIECVFGSDAHNVSNVGNGLKEAIEIVNRALPASESA